MEEEIEQLSLFGEEQPVNFDEYDENGVEKKTQLGDLWKLGNHRLMCGDSTSQDDVKKLTGGLLLI